MSAFSENEVHEKIQASEARVEARLAKFEGKVDAQFAEVNGRMDAKFAEVHSKMDRQYAELKGHMADIRAEVHRVSAETIKWVAGIVIGATVLGLTVMTFVLNNAIPKAAPAPPTPVVITVPRAGLAPPAR